MRLAHLFPLVTALACANAPATAPSAASPVSSAPARAPSAAVQAPPPLEELPAGGAAARISGPASALSGACKDAIARARLGLDALKAMPAPRDAVTTLGWYDDANAVINDLDFQAELARQASPDGEMRKAGEECDREIQAFATAIYQDRAVYDALSGLDLSGQDGSTVWWMKRDLREFRRAGRGSRRRDPGEGASAQRRGGRDRPGVRPEHPRGHQDGRLRSGGSRRAARRLPEGASTGDGREDRDHHRLPGLPPLPGLRPERPVHGRSSGAPTTPAPHRRTSRCSRGCSPSATSWPPSSVTRTGRTTPPRTR